MGHQLNLEGMTNAKLELRAQSIFLSPASPGLGWYYNATPHLRFQKNMIHVQKVLEFDPKNTKMQSKKY